MLEIESGENDSIDIIYLIRILINNLKYIVLITFLFMISILIIVIISKKLPAEKSFMPDIYSPKCVVMLNNTTGSGGIGDLLGGSSGLGALASLTNSSNSSVSDADLAKKLALKNTFYESLDDDFNLSKVYKTEQNKFPRTSLRNIINTSLFIEIDKDSGLLEISYSDTDKKLATKITNRVTDLLEEEFSQIDEVRNRNQFSIAEEQKLIVESEISRLQSEIISFQNKHNILDVSVTSSEIARLLSGLQTQLLQKEVAIESYGKIANIRDPQYIRLINEKSAIETSIRKLENGEVGDYPALKDLPILSMELAKLKSALEVQLMGYKAIEQQYQTLKLTAGGTGPTFQVIEYAEVPEIKSGPSRGKLCIIVTFAGFMFSIFFVFFKEAIINIKNNPEIMKRLRGEK